MLNEATLLADRHHVGPPDTDVIGEFWLRLLWLLAAAPKKWDALTIATAIKIILLAWLEVVFTVVPIGMGGAGLPIPASIRVAAALSP